MRMVLFGNGNLDWKCEHKKHFPTKSAEIHSSGISGYKKLIWLLTIGCR